MVYTPTQAACQAIIVELFTLAKLMDAKSKEVDGAKRTALEAASAAIAQEARERQTMLVNSFDKAA